MVGEQGPKPPGGHPWPVLHSPEQVSSALTFKYTPTNPPPQTNPQLALEEGLSHRPRDLSKCPFLASPPFTLKRVLENIVSSSFYVCKDF